MAHFYGTVESDAGMTTRCGFKTSGLVTCATSWKGAIRTTIWHDKDSGEDRYCVDLVPLNGVGLRRELARGTF